MLSSIREKYPNFLLFSLCSILFTFLLSITSPLMIKYLSWDTNAFHSVGRVLKHGGVLYKDVFEQKGPLFLFLFYIQELISEKFYIFLFAINVVLNYVIMHFTFKYSNSVLNSKVKSYVVCAPAIALYYILAYSTLIPESFIYVFFIYMIYSINENTKLGQVIFTKLQYFINGLLISFMIFSKFSLSFSMIIMYFALFILLIKNKKFTELVNSIVFTFIGFVTLTLPVFIYFFAHHYVGGFINDYLVVNFKYYGVMTIDPLLSTDYERNLKFPFSLIQNVFKSFTHYIQLGTDLSISSLKVISIITIVYLFVKKAAFNNAFFVIIISLFAGYIYGEYFGNVAYLYYLLPGSAFSIILFANLLRGLKLNKFSKVSFITLTIIFSISLQPSIWINSKLFKDNRPTQNELTTKYILEHNKEPKIAQLMLDEGIYLSTNSLPISKYFYAPNRFFKYDDIWENYLQIIKNKKADYVIVYPGTLTDQKSIQPRMKKIVKYLEKNYKRSLWRSTPHAPKTQIKDLWEKK